MNLSLREWSLIVESLKITGHELGGLPLGFGGDSEYYILADKIEKEKFTDNISSFNPD
jgi:hypothetical protein